MISRPSTVSCRGFTLVEFLIVIAMITAIATIAVPSYLSSVEVARTIKAVAEIKVIVNDIEMFRMQNGRIPDSLAEIGRSMENDPWGRPYEYLSFTTLKGKGNGKKRKDKNLVPINSECDLYRRGRDGETAAPLTAKKSHDDIIYADDGDFIGRADKY